MIFGKYKINEVLSTLWIFVTVNYIYCDVFTLHFAPDLKELLTGTVGSIVLDEQFLLWFAMIMQLPMIMIVLAKFVPRKINRILNIIVGLFMTTVQSWSLYPNGGTLHYNFFSAFEIATTFSTFSNS